MAELSKERRASSSSIHGKRRGSDGIQADAKMIVVGVWMLENRRGSHCGAADDPKLSKAARA